MWYALPYIEHPKRSLLIVLLLQQYFFQHKNIVQDPHGSLLEEPEGKGPQYTGPPPKIIISDSDCGSDSEVM